MHNRTNRSTTWLLVVLAPVIAFVSSATSAPPLAQAEYPAIPGPSFSTVPPATARRLPLPSQEPHPSSAATVGVPLPGELVAFVQPASQDAEFHRPDGRNAKASWQMSVVAAGDPPPTQATPPPNAPLPDSLEDLASRLDPGSPEWSVERRLEQIQKRLDELETARVAHEDATREVIKKSLADYAKGSKINEFVTFGGTLEALAAWAEDFDGVAESGILLNTAELDFEIQVNDWTLGSIVFEYDDGTNVLFPTNDGDTSFVDRINVDTAFVTFGNTERCPLFARVGRMIVPFGISTGDPVADVLTIEDPLTVEVFETRQDAALFGYEIRDPVSCPTKPVPEIVAYPVRPLLLNPFLQRASRCANRLAHYCPIVTPKAAPIKPTDPAIIWRTQRVFNTGIYFYNGDVTEGGEDHIEQIGATLGGRTQGYFRSYGLPWSVDLDVDFNSSVFDSQFLGFEYRRFLDEIGYVPGMAAHVKSMVGPVSLVVEWNAAVRDATFTDEALALDPDGNWIVVPGDDIRIAPSAWQVSLGYQFDWNPTVQFIGAQGTYFAIGYSESQDLAGVTRVIDGEEVRVGFVPQRRFVVDVGEWVLDGLRIAVEYAHIVDYTEEEGGTGRSADAVFGLLTYEW